MNDDVWRALADPTRRALLDLLRDGPRTTGALAEAFPGVTRFAVMKHLGVLTDAGLVVVRRRGRERWNHLNAVPLRQAYERWLAPYAERAAVTSLRLKDFVEDTMDGTLDVANDVTIDAPPARVWDGITRMGSWWPHRFKAGAGVVFEPVLGGRFYEDWGDGAGALYGTVTRITPYEHLSVTGPMGMGGPVVGVWSLDLAERDGRTVLRYSHRAFGEIDEETRASYTAGWPEVIGALRTALGA
ncbi:MAG TPA: metalloregulator ArsR/SmtB family transcription factor [Frankiaceae bacterium]|nr:metalloregulator ArsR/SmtB family transcription factor [Frankiaceae bacterium]